MLGYRPLPPKDRHTSEPTNDEHELADDGYGRQYPLLRPLVVRRSSRTLMHILISSLLLNAFLVGVFTLHRSGVIKGQAICQADDVFDMSIENLFENEPDAKEVIKKKEIYQVMETVTDKCEDAANVIETIIIKYA